MQDTITFKTPMTGKEVVIKGYLSGGDDEAIQRLIQAGYNYQVEIDTSQPEDGPQQPTGSAKPSNMTAKIDANARLDSERKAIELLVISVDGKTENVLEAVMALPAGDTAFVKQKINEMTDNSKVTETQKKA